MPASTTRRRRGVPPRTGRRPPAPGAALEPLQGSPVNIGDPADAVAHGASGVIKRIGLSQPSSRIKIISQQSDYRLANGEAAAGQNYKNPLSRLNEAIHLAAYVDLIEACIGPRVRSQHEAFSSSDSQTICQFILCGESTASYTDCSYRICDSGQQEKMCTINPMNVIVSASHVRKCASCCFAKES